MTLWSCWTLKWFLLKLKHFELFISRPQQIYCNDDADSFDITEELTFSSDEDLGDDIDEEEDSDEVKWKSKLKQELQKY